MRFAILADIHANREAFEAVLDRIARSRIDRIVLLGDIIGYGPDPEFCVEKAVELVETGALAVVGNHDEAIGNPTGDMNSAARLAIEWTRGRLSARHRAFLSALPETRTEEGTLFVHASARAPRAWEYITGPMQAERSLRATSARVTLVGHVHCPRLWRLTSAGVAIGHEPFTGVEIPLAQSFAWLGVMGSVGQPRDGNCAAAFGILDTRARTLSFERLAYDHFATSRKIRDAGLPESLAIRLLHGT